MAKRIVVLTGGIGSGKSLAADLFAQHGVTIVDADQISRALTAPGGAALPDIINTFGTAYIAGDGGLDRAKMRDLVFQAPDKRQQLEAILHPIIRNQASEALAKAPEPYAVYVVPLWVEHQHHMITPDHVILVDCPEELQITRVMQRSGLSRDQVLAVMATQASRQERQKAADLILTNDQGVAHLAKQVSDLHQRLIHS